MRLLEDLCTRRMLSCFLATAGHRRRNFYRSGRKLDRPSLTGAPNVTPDRYGILHGLTEMYDIHDNAALTVGGFSARHRETPARHSPAEAVATATASLRSLLSRSAGCMPSSGTRPSQRPPRTVVMLAAPHQQTPVTAVTSEDASGSLAPLWAVNGPVCGLSKPIRRYSVGHCGQPPRCPGPPRRRAVAGARAGVHHVRGDGVRR